MQKLQFDYYMQIEYEEEVSECHFTIKCLPQSNARQQIEQSKIELYPPVEYCYGKDGLNNSQIYGINAVPHSIFWFRITGTACVGLADYEEVENDSLTMIFRHSHGMNIPGERITDYYNANLKEKVLQMKQEESQDDRWMLSYADYTMKCLHSDFQYKTNSTQIHTTAEEAFCQGHGVCQDYAHIYIALMHLAGVPARYVTGLIVGEGASHAWVEILSDGKWYGFDPTNNKIVNNEHIKIGIGRDAHDCMINRGIMHGGGFHKQTIKVCVTRVCK